MLVNARQQAGRGNLSLFLRLRSLPIGLCSHRSRAEISTETEGARGCLGAPCLQNVGYGSVGDMAASSDHVRSYPRSGHLATTAGCLLSARNRHSTSHSITSSARSRNTSGIARPIAFAVLLLTR